MMTECIFCRIAAHASTADVLYEDNLVMAFLDLYPIRPGHALIIPKQHFDYFDDVPVQVITSIILLGQELAVVMKARYGVPRVAFLFTGGDIPHTHAHVVPIHERYDITLRRNIVEQNAIFKQTPQMTHAELAAEAASLVQALSARS
jgi:histidine triad (HIT) family protein